MTLTDRLETIAILQQNVKENTQHSHVGDDTDTMTSVQGAPYKASQCDSLNREDNSCYLQKEDNSLNDKVVQLTPRSVRVEVLNWMQRSGALFDDIWDVVIGADIIYIESTFDHLLSTISQLQFSTMILSCRLRYAKDHKFIRRAKQMFNVEQLLYDKGMDITIYSLRKVNKTE